MADNLDAVLQQMNQTENDSLAQPQQSDTDKVFQLMNQTEAQNATASLSNAVGKSPANHAKNLQLSRKTGLSTDAVESSSDAISKALKLKAFDTSKLQVDSPVVVQHMSNPDNAIISQNDVENLSALEHVMNAFKASVSQTIAGAEDTGSQLAGFYKMLSTAEQKAGFSVGDNTIQRFGNIAESYRKDAAVQNKIVSGIEKSRSDLPRVPRVALSGLQSILPSATAVAVSLVTRSRLLGLLTFGLPVFGNETQKALAQGLDPISAATHGARQFGFEIITEISPFTSLLKFTKGKGNFVKTLTDFLGKEIIGEQINTIAGEFESWLNLPVNSNKTFESFLKEVPSNAFDTLIATIVGGGLTGVAVGGLSKGTQIIQDRGYKKAEAAAFDVSGSEAGQTSIDAIAHYAGQSETKKVDPETFREFVNSVDDKSKVVLDYEKVNEFLQTKTPEELKSDVLLQVLQQKIDDNLAGEDLEMSVADFSTDVVGSDHYQDLRPHVKLGHDAATPFRFEQAVEQNRSFLESIEATANENVSQYVESQAIFASIRDQLIDSGRHTKATASVAAQMVPAYATAVAVRNGVSVKDVYEGWGLTIEGPQTGRAAENAQRAAALEQRRPVVDKNEELLSAIRSIGGISQKLASDILGEKNTVAAGAGSLFRKSGQNLDVIATQLQPMGFNIDLNSVDGGVATLSQMINDSHVLGKKFYTFEGQNQLEEQRQFDLEQADQGPQIDYTKLPGYGEPFDQVSNQIRTLIMSDLPESMNQVQNNTSLANLKKNRAEYDAAKTGGIMEAAISVVNRVVKPGVIENIRNQLDPNKPIYIVAVHQRESESMNMLPVAYGATLARELGAEYVTDIVKTIGSKNTGKSQVDRLTDQHGYEGKIPDPDGQYIVVDDNFTSGATVVPLIELIQSQGGTVPVLSTLAVSRYGKSFKPKKEKSDLLLKQTGLTPEEISAIIGHDFENLTGAELQILLNSTRQGDGASKLRAIFAGRSRASSAGVQPLSQGPPENLKGQVWFEVAPDPNSIDADDWNKLTITERKDVSESILRQFAPAILSTMKVNGNVVSQHGGWEGQPNPSTALVLEDPSQTQKAMRALGYVFSQEGMYGVASEPFAGSTPAEMITIEYPDSFTEDQVNGLYQELWKIKDSSGKGRVQGFSAHDGHFMMVNVEEDSGITTEDLKELVDVRLSNTEYDGLTGRKNSVYVSYEGKGGDNYGFELDRSHENRGTAPGFASFEQGSIDRIRRTALASRSLEVESVIRGRRTKGVRAATVRPETRESDGSLKGLPRFRGAKHSEEVEQVAREYMEAAGIPYLPLTNFVPVDIKRAKRIANEYEAMKHAPEDPAVAAAFQAMIKETTAQYEAIMKTGLNVEFVPAGEPYPYENNLRLMTEDVIENNHIWVFSTREGFGTDAEFKSDKNPLSVETKFKISGQTALANDLFRVVHDYFGHVKEGVGFRASGEENAWRAHSVMFSDEARRAMTSETRGQNSQLNFGKHGEHNRTAKGADTYFADQKTGLLPEWVVNDGAFDNQSVVNTSFEQRNSLGFFSMVQTAVLTMNTPGFKTSKKNPDGEARGADIWAKLKTSGVKKEELELLGIEEFLTIRPDIKFSRDEVAEFVKENGVNIVEINSEEQSTKEDIVWNEEIDTDSSNWGGHVDDFLYDYDNSNFQDIIDNQSYGLSSTTLADIIDEAVDNSDIEDLPADAQAALKELKFLSQFSPKQLDLPGVSLDLVSRGEEENENLMNAMMQVPDVRRDVEQVFNDAAEEDYMQEPRVTVTDDGDNVRIQGNDDIGYTVQATNGRFISDSAYSMDEAQAQAANYLIEFGVISDDGARWGDYVTDGNHDNYREKKLTLPDIANDFLYDVHFPERNILAFLRITDRDMLTGTEPAVVPDEQVTFTVNVIDNPVKNAVVKRVMVIVDSNGTEIFSGGVDGKVESESIARAMKLLHSEKFNFKGYTSNGDGTLTKRGFRVSNTPKKTYFIDEFQSDWHQQGRKHGYATGADITEALDTANSEQQLAADRYDELTAKRKTDQKLDDAINHLATHVTGGNDIFLLINRAVEGDKNLDKSVRSDIFKTIAGVPDLEEVAQHIENAVKAQGIVHTERKGIPPAPFGADAWITLGVKRAIMDAIDNGYEAVAWPNAEVLVERWSEEYRTLYENQYEKKMPSIVKKLTGITPVKLDLDGGPYTDGDHGYYTIPITDELKKRYSAEGFALFQDVNGFYEPGEVMIRLTETSNLSTFLHEFGHFMLDTEQKSKSELNTEIKKWFGRNTKSIAKEATAQMKRLLLTHQKNLDNGVGNAAFLESQIKSLESGISRGIVEADIDSFLKFGTTGSNGVNLGIQRATHEQFARAWEAYIMEGKSPSLEMNNVFRIMARWMVDIYKSIKNLGVSLDDDIRKVFDRLIATEDQIDAAEARAKLQPLFTDAVSAGMTEEQWAKYQDRLKAPRDKASETLRDKLIREYQRTMTAWWKTELAAVTDDEREKLKDEPLYKSIIEMKTGTIKMDHAEVKEKYGVKDKRGRSIIPPKLRGMTVAGGEGAPIQEVAGLFGFTSGDKMIQDILVSPTIAEQAKINAEAVMINEHGDILNDGSIEQLADDALENEERGKLILAELKQLLKGTSQAVLDRRILKAMAEEKIGELSFKKNNPARYRAAEIKSAQAAATALANGDKPAAAAAKTQQAMNHFLAVASTEAKNGTLKIVDRVARYRRKKVREAIIKSGDGYMEQIDKILDRFEFRKSSTLKAVDRKNQSLAEFIAARTDEGANIVLDPAVLDETFVTHWKNIPFSDLQGVSDSLKNLEHVARYANKMKLEGEELDFKALAAKFIEHIEQQKAKYPRKDTALISEDIKDKNEPKLYIRWAMSHMTKIPFLTSWLDQGKRVGMAHDLIMQPFTDALHNKYELHKEATLPVMQALSSRSKDDLRRHHEKIFIPEIGQSLTGGQVLAVALNTGNTGNLRKMLLGEGWAKDDSEVSIDNPTLHAILSHLTESDAKLVQLIWDQMNLLYPKLAEVHQRTSGVAPMKVVAVPVTLAGVKLNGGYYPLVYSRARSHRAEKNAERREAEIDSMFDRSGMVQQSVTAGATNERTEFTDKIQLSLDVIPSHFEEVIHYVTHHEAVANVNRLISHPGVANAITGVLGEDEYKQLKPWLNDIAKDGRESGVKNAFEDLFQKLRLGTTLGIMGFKASTGIMQTLGLFTTAAEFGPSRTMKAIFNVVGRAKYMKAVRRIFGSTNDIESAWEFAVARSKVLQHRTQTMDREIGAAIKTLKGKKGLIAGKLPAVQEASMMHIALIQTYIVDLPTWHAAYDAELEESGDPDKAARHGDWAVENLQGSGAVKDMAAIFRNQSKVFTTITMFMTFFSSLWNLTRGVGRSVGHTRATTIASKLMFLFVVPVVAEMLLRGEFGDGDDEDEQLQAMLTKIVLYPTTSVPLIRDAASAFGKYRYNFSPVTSVIGKGIDGSKSILNAATSDDKELTLSQVKNATKLVGAFVGIPGTSQAWATGEHLYDVIEEGEDLTLKELIYGPKR